MTEGTTKRSILSGLPGTEAEVKAQSEYMAGMIREIFGDNEFTRLLDESHVWKQMKEGLTLADILQLSKDQLEALYSVGHQALAAGQPEKAKDAFIQLIQIDPMDERFVYMLGLSCQMLGEIEHAAKVYVQFIARDATNPEGYLRLAECLLAAGEVTEARDTFRTARNMAEGKPEFAVSLAYAKTMIETAEARLAASASA